MNRKKTRWVVFALLLYFVCISFTLNFTLRFNREAGASIALPFQDCIRQAVIFFDWTEGVSFRINTIFNDNLSNARQQVSFIAGGFPVKTETVPAAKRFVPLALVLFSLFYQSARTDNGDRLPDLRDFGVPGQTLV